MQRVETLASSSGPATHPVPPLSRGFSHHPRRPQTAPNTNGGVAATSTSPAPPPPRPRCRRDPWGCQAESTDGTIADELAALEERMAAWKEQRLLEVEEEAAVSEKAGLGHLTVEMEKRMQQRREAERVRALQRMHRLLDTLEPRLAKDADLIPSPTTHVAESDACGEMAVHIAAEVPVGSPRLPESPLAYALAACGRHHLIGCQRLSVEEREARSQLERHHQFVVDVTHLTADEQEFRTCLEEWEASSYTVLAAKASTLQSCEM